MRNGITNSMRHLDGQDGAVYIFHSIYGNQKMDTKINLIDDEDKVGVCIGRQEIYLTMDELTKVEISQDAAFIGGDEMQIKIECK